MEPITGNNTVDVVIRFISSREVLNIMQTIILSVAGWYFSQKQKTQNEKEGDSVLYNLAKAAYMNIEQDVRKGGKDANKLEQAVEIVKKMKNGKLSTQEVLKVISFIREIHETYKKEEEVKKDKTVITPEK